MGSTDDWLIHEHSLYEDLLANCQEAVEAEDWRSVDALFSKLITHLKRHMALEEEVLYPAYEAAAHAPQGPTGALRHEHDEIVRLVTDMTRVIRTRDSDHVFECLEHLENRMIKHHEKEEDIFLPMASLILNDQRADLLRQLADFQPSGASRKWEI